MGRGAWHNRLSDGGPSHRCGGRRRWRGGVHRFMTARAESKPGREREQSFLDLCHTPKLVSAHLSGPAFKHKRLCLSRLYHTKQVGDGLRSCNP